MIYILYITTQHQMFHNNNPASQIFDKNRYYIIIYCTQELPKMFMNFTIARLIKINSAKLSIDSLQFA